MIREEKQSAALDSLHFVLVRARALAYEAGNKELGDLLDAAEILPIYILEDEDRTETFREAVKEIAEHYACGYAFQRFDEASTTVVAAENKKAS